MSEKEMHEVFKNGDIAETLAEHAGPERFENVFYPLTGRVAFLDFDQRGIDISDKSREAMEERTAQWAMMDANFSHWVAAFTDLVDNILDAAGIDEIEVDDNDAPLFRKGDLVMVKDKCNRTWNKATYVTEWNGFFYTEAQGGRNLNRWEECMPFMLEHDSDLDEAIQCGKDEGWIRDETWN